MYDFRHVKEHIEVYYNGEFLFSADNIEEAKNEIKNLKESRECAYD